jgi:hypothetical protein
VARSFGRVFCSIWADADFVARGPQAHRLYLFLLSQPKLSLVGVIDYMPRRWASASAGISEEDVGRALAELERHRFVLVDQVTDEVLVRSLVRHDGVKSSPLLKGLWSSWKAVSSPSLRDAILRELPDDVWANEKVPVPSGVVRPSGESSPDLDTHSDTHTSTHSNGYRNIPKTSDFHFPPPPQDAVVTVAAVIEILAQRDLEAARANPDVDSRPRREQAWLAKARHTLTERHQARLDDILSNDHGMTCEEIADLLEPSPPPERQPITECDDCGWHEGVGTPHPHWHAEWVAGVEHEALATVGAGKFIRPPKI